MIKETKSEETVQVVVCDECGKEIDYEKENVGAYTVGGIGISWEKLGAIKVKVQDVSERDFHVRCLAIVLDRGEPLELKATLQKEKGGAEEAVEAKP